MKILLYLIFSLSLYINEIFYHLLKYFAVICIFYCILLFSEYCFLNLILSNISISRFSLIILQWKMIQNLAIQIYTRLFSLFTY